MLRNGHRLGDYEIIAPLGAGGMGEVYRARDTRLGRDVAVKVLRDGFDRDADRLRRFEAEARAVGAVSHPSVVIVFGAGEHDGRPYLVTELLEGTDLRERLIEGPLPARKAIEYGAQIARGPGRVATRGRGVERTPTPGRAGRRSAAP